MSGAKKEKKIIKHKPRHPRPSKEVNWSERHEDKPSYKKKRKREKEVERDILSE